MEVILRKDHSGLGYKYDVVSVAPGYARNFLFPRGIAELATDSAKRNLEDMLKSKKKKLEKEKEDAKKIAEVLEKEAICVYVNVNKDGDLFNRLSLQQIVDAIKLQTKIDVKASDIHMSEADIKSLGRYVVGVYLHKSVVSSVTLNVMKNEEKKNM